MVSGTCSSDFEPVREAFAANFAERGEVGAGVCITVDGQTVADLWGGKVGVDEGAAPWEADTLVIVYSCTKGATAMCAHLLADQGKLDLDAPVADYWPEYAVNGKERTTVRMMLDAIMRRGFGRPFDSAKQELALAQDKPPEPTEPKFLVGRVER